MTEDLPQIEVSDAGEADLNSLTGYCSESLLRDYFRLAKQSTLRCLTLRCAGQIIAFGLLVFQRPEFWPAARDDLQRLPEVVGISVTPKFRRRGYGSAFMRGIELETAKAGYSRLYLAVDPVENPAAFAFYRRLNYQPLSTEPYRAVWEMKDSQQRIYRGENWLIDMVKDL